MRLKFVYTDRTTAIIPYQRAKYVCPLLASPAHKGVGCPVEHKLWPKGGCSTTLTYLLRNLREMRRFQEKLASAPA